MKTVRINRAKWANGGTRWFSSLCSNHGFIYERRCCLGFALNQLCKIPYKHLEDEARPSDLAWETIPTGKVIVKNFETIIDLEEKAIEFNDSTRITDSMREKKLIKLFKSHNVNLVFYGKTKE